MFRSSDKLASFQILKRGKSFQLDAEAISYCWFSKRSSFLSEEERQTVKTF